MTGAVDRFLDASRVLGHDVEVRRFPQGTKTAQDAAQAVGCELGQIVKSLVFVADGAPVLALVSGVNRADTDRLRALVGAAEVRRANADEVRAATGYPIGGTPPFNWSSPQPVTFIDEDLMGHDVVWAGAGAPDAVFAIVPADLVRLSGGVVVALAGR
jgi:prolyl-tRNA editing enzyme YbaK/EbsC (Cys-tRNA(Pro) deacylase)